MIGRPSYAHKRCKDKGDHRENLVGAVVDHLGGARKRIQLRRCAVFCKADALYEAGVAKGIGLDLPQVERLAAMTQEGRVADTRLGSVVALAVARLIVFVMSAGPMRLGDKSANLALTGGGCLDK